MLERRSQKTESFDGTLTMPPEEAAWITQAYGDPKAKVILEYGAGGSTVLAASHPGKTIFSVESDVDWIASMEAYFDREPGQSAVTLHHAKVGPTQDWGMPAGEDHWRKFRAYPLSVWDRPDFEHPDVVLIDGRFRKACLLTVLFRATRPVTVYFDDYLNRDNYHEVEEFTPWAETRGRMARFDITPQAIDPARLSTILKIYGQQA